MYYDVQGLICNYCSVSLIGRKKNNEDLHKPTSFIQQHV